jgi:type IV pilus assembly protein PilY1
MKRKIKHILITGIFLTFFFIFVPSGFADDTCVFGATADDIPPFIVMLLDNGAEMEQIIWHSSYDNSVDYTPNPTSVTSVFTNSDGYAVDKSGSTYYLYPIQSDLTLDTANGIAADSSGDDPTWTLTVNPGEAKIMTIALPEDPSSSPDGDGIKDNATIFRYSTNYLNWIYYSTGDGSYGQVSAVDDGTDLPDKSRFYYAKKAIFNVSRLTANKVEFSIYNFTSNSSGASSVQPLGFVVNTPLTADPANNTLESNFVNNINNMGTVTYSPLAEGLARVGGYYASSSADVNTVDIYCQKLFALVISPGVSSEDQAIGSSSSPTSFADYDSDGEGGTVNISGTTYTVPLNQNGSTYLDDVATYLYTNDIPQHSKAPGFQRVSTYTIGFMGNVASNAFLMNTSNNGNGISDPNDEDYGKYHFEAENPNELSKKLMDAISNIISKTSTFTAPVVPVTRTTSGNSIYMAFFKPLNSNFWEGNVTKFGIEINANGEIEIVDKFGNPATWPNGAIKDDAEPFWTTIDWADSSASNSILNSDRIIYAGDTTTFFTVGNMTTAMLDSPTSITVNGTTVTGVEKVVNYIRGADVLDEDGDTDTGENRSVITGDILHSEPLVLQYNNDYSGTVIYYGSNDGMLHAVEDVDGSEKWAFIPSNLLPRLKYILEGAGHQYFVDSSPKVYILGGNRDMVVDTGETAILICGERRGGSYYFGIDITNPSSPTYLGDMCNSGCTINVGGELGDTWSEPVFGVVNNGGSYENVFIVGGGYSSTNASGRAVIVASFDTSNIIAQWNNSNTTGMDYSIPSTVKVIDEDNNGIIDKIYVGDLGGQMWRFGKFTYDNGDPLTFPDCDENINVWEGEVIFNATTDTNNPRKIFYPPSITLQTGFDMVFFGTGDRANACDSTTSDGIYAVTDVHETPVTTLEEGDLVNIADPDAATPVLPVDKGFYLPLAPGEKVLGENMVFYKVLYVTTFTPSSSDPCMPGGFGKLYALKYLTGGAAIDFTGDSIKDQSVALGGGIPSKPVMVIPPGDTPPSIIISVGSTLPDADSEEDDAGTLTIPPLTPNVNFFYLWWQML